MSRRCRRAVWRQVVVVEVLVVRSEVVMFVLGANSQVEGCAGWRASVTHLLAAFKLNVPALTPTLLAAKIGGPPCQASRQKASVARSEQLGTAMMAHVNHDHMMI